MDVGVLNLQIHDNSEQAGKGLNQVADALFRVKRAVNGVTRLGTVAGQIERIARAVNNNISSSTIATLKQFGDALARLKGLGDIDISIRAAGQITRTMQEIENGRRSMEAMGAASREMADAVIGGFVEVQGTVQQASSEVRAFEESAKEAMALLGAGETNDGMEMLMRTLASMGGMMKGDVGPAFEMMRRMMMSLRDAGNGEIVKVFSDLRETFSALNGYLSGGLTSKFSEFISMLKQMADFRASHALPGAGAIPVTGSVDAPEEMAMIVTTANDLMAINGDITNSISQLIRGTDWLGESLRGLNGLDAQMEAIQSVMNGTGLSYEEVTRQLYELSGGFINLRNAVREAGGSGDMQTFRQEMEEIIESTVDVNSKLDLLRRKVAIVREEMEHRSAFLRNLGQDPLDDKIVVNYRLQILSLNEQIEKLEANMRKMGAAAQAAPMPKPDGLATVDNLVQNYSEIDLLTMKYDGLRQALADDISYNRLDSQQIADRVMKLQQLKNKIDELKEAQEKESESTDRMRGAFETFKQGIQKMFPTISGLIKRFSQLMKYRMLRAVLKHIAEGFSEGVENVYHYSKAVGTDLAPAMDSAVSSFKQMKNAIGAAVAPAIQALIPIIQTVVNWFITMTNCVNQFLALLRGQSTWTRALAVSTEAYAGSAKKAKGAARDMKEMLADWDELNIIQSQGGGAGSGLGDTAEEYGKMFEEVSKFEGWIKELVDGIKDRFGSVWDLVKRIGLTILGWKISKAFQGILGTLGGILAALGIIDIEFNISALLNGNYLKTGETGWLVADVLQTLIGGVLMQKILGNVLGGKLAMLGIPIMFSVSAIAGFTTLIGDTDTSAISREGIVNNIVNSLKLGGVAAYLMHAADMGSKTSIIGGMALTAAVFGAVTNLKASITAIKNEEITEDYIKSTALGSLALGLGAATIAKLLVPGVTGAQALGFGAAVGAAGGLFAVGATVGITATVKAVKSGVTEETIKNAAISSLSLGAGAALVAKMAGASMLAAFGWTAGAALFVMAATIGIAAVIEANRKMARWGNYDASVEEIEAFIKEKGFEVDVPATVKIISSAIDTTGVKKDEVETALSTALGDFEIIRLGLAQGDDYAKLRADILGDESSGATGLIGKIDEFVKEAQAAGKLTLQFTPTLVGNSDTDKAGWLSNYTAGWETVDDFARKKGAEIGDLLIKAEKGKLEEGESEILATLMSQLNRVTEAVTRAKTDTEQFGTLQMNIGDISQASFDDIVTYFKEYKTNLTDQYRALINEQYALQGQLVAALFVIDPEGEEYKKAKAAYDAMGEHLFDSLNESVEAAAQPGITWLANFLREKYGEELSHVFDSGDYEYFNPFEGIDLEDKSAKEIAAHVREWLGETVGNTNNDLANYISALGLNAYTLLDDNAKHMLEYLLKQTFGEEKTKEILEQLMPGFSEAVEDETKKIKPVETKPIIDVSSIKDSTESATGMIQTMALKIKRILEGLDGLGFHFDFDVGFNNTLGDSVFGGSGGGAGRITMQTRAGGGFVRSGDLVIADENGRFEMMGRMGSQPVVANNQQIVDGISRGVTTANGDVVSELRTLGTLMQRMLSKEFVARAVPGANWGAHNARSEEAYDRVRG